MKNALDYSTGNIMISLTQQTLVVSNPYDSQLGTNIGYGCGLIIVERICERMKWQVNIIDDGKIFRAEIDFLPSPQDAMEIDDGR
jgi:hypothetical protein